MKFTNSERDTILAALRYWQATLEEADGHTIGDFKRYELVATNCEEHKALTADEIDDLCEKVNTTKADNLAAVGRSTRR